MHPSTSASRLRLLILIVTTPRRQLSVTCRCVINSPVNTIKRKRQDRNVPWHSKCRREDWIVRRGTLSTCRFARSTYFDRLTGEQQCPLHTNLKQENKQWTRLVFTIRLTRCFNMKFTDTSLTTVSGRRQSNGWTDGFAFHVVIRVQHTGQNGW